MKQQDIVSDKLTITGDAEYGSIMVKDDITVIGNLRATEITAGGDITVCGYIETEGSIKVGGTITAIGIRTPQRIVADTIAVIDYIFASSLEAKKVSAEYVQVFEIKVENIKIDGIINTTSIYAGYIQAKEIYAAGHIICTSLVCDGTVKVESNITANSGISVGGDITARGGIVSGSYILATGEIIAPHIYAGTQYGSDEWETYGIILAAKKPDTIVTGYWKEK